MFDIGLQELIIIFLVALLVFGPERLPEVAKTMGKWFGDIGKSIQNTRAQMEREFYESEKEAGAEAGIPNMTDEPKSIKEPASGEEKKEG